MFKGIANMANLLRHAQQMGGRIKEATDQLKAKKVTGTSGGGMVEVEANGLGEVLRVKIDPTLLAGGDREMIEDLLPPAVNQAINRSRELHVELMQSMTQGVDLSGLGEMLSQFTGQGPGTSEKP